MQLGIRYDVQSYDLTKSPSRKPADITVYVVYNLDAVRHYAKLNMGLVFLRFCEMTYRYFCDFGSYQIKYNEHAARLVV